MHFSLVFQAVSTPTSIVDLTFESDVTEAITRSLQDGVEGYNFTLIFMTYISIIIMCIEVNTLRDVVLMLQRKNGMKLPSTAEEWDMTPRCDLDVRRSHVVVDGVRAAKKTRFNCTNLLRVCLM